MSDQPTAEKGSRAVSTVAVGAALFAATGALVFRYLLQYGKTNVWVTDGFYQHFPALYFVNTWFRGFLAHPAAGLPLWSWNLGLGADVLGTLAFYAVGDPFTLLSMLFPVSHMETAYLITYLARIAGAGLTSALYFRKMGGRPLPILIGSIIYAFTTFTMIAGLKHPYFVSAIVFLPLLLFGVEDLLRKGRPYALVGAVFVAAISNFYFFYMQAIILVLYAVIRYVELTPKGERRRQLLRVGGKTAGATLLGMMLASPVMLPALDAFFTSSRANSHRAINLFYSIRTYGGMLASLSLPRLGPQSSYLGFSPVAFVILPVLFMRRGNSTVKWMAGLIAGFVALPFFGSMFNGFAFTSNRFAFTWGLFIACATVLVLSDARPLSRRELLATSGVFIAYIAVFLLSSQAGLPHAKHQFVPIAVAMIAAAILGFERWQTTRASRRPRSAETEPTTQVSMSFARWSLLAVVMLGIAGNAALAYDKRFSVLVSTRYVDRGDVLDPYLQQKSGILASGIPDASFFRVDKQRYVYGPSNRMAKANDSLVQSYRGTAMELSVTNGRILDLMRELEARNVWLSFGYTGFDERAIPTALVGEKYLIGSAGLEPFVPYGFSKIETSGTASVHRNDWVLPLGFVYDAAIPRSAYDQLGALDKQAALLQGAVVDDEVASSMRTMTPTSSVVSVPYSVTRTDGVRMDATGRRLTVERAGGTITLGFPPTPDAELYVELSNPRYRLPKGAPRTRRAINYRVPDDRAGKTVGRLLPSSHYYWPNDTHLVNLGYRPNGASAVVIRFQDRETVTFESLRVLASPMKDFPAQAARLRGRALEDIVVGGDRVSGSVDTSSGGLLFLSIPFSSGWKARVDGTPAEVVRVNTAFTGIRVAPGNHRIELAYAPAPFRTGVAAFSLGLMSLCFMLVRDVRSRRTRGRLRGEQSP